MVPWIINPIYTLYLSHGYLLGPNPLVKGSNQGAPLKTARGKGLRGSLSASGVRGMPWKLPGQPRWKNTSSPKPCPSGKKTHTFHPRDWSAVTVSCWLVKDIPTTSRTIKTNQPTPGPFFQLPKKKKHELTTIFWRLGLFFGGKKPPNLRNINFQQKKTSLLGLNIRLSCLVVNLNFRLFIPSNSQGFEMGAKCSSGYELGEILLRCVVPFFFAENTSNSLWGGGGGSKKLRTISFVFSKFGWKNQLELSKKHELSMDWSFHRFWRLRYLMKSSFHAIFPQVRKRKKTTGSQETSEAAASELATWPWSSSSSSQAGKISTPHGVEWGQIVSNEIVEVTQVRSSKFWLCNLFQKHTCSVFSVFLHKLVAAAIGKAPVCHPFGSCSGELDRPSCTESSSGRSG